MVSAVLQNIVVAYIYEISHIFLSFENPFNYHLQYQTSLSTHLDRIRTHFRIIFYFYLLSIYVACSPHIFQEVLAIQCDIIARLLGFIAQPIV